MQQMQIEESKVIPVDYEAGDLPAPVRQFKPTLYREDEMICCILGPDKDRGVFACGATEDEAISMWTAAFTEKLRNSNADDKVAQYIRDTLATSKNDVW